MQMLVFQEIQLYRGFLDLATDFTTHLEEKALNFLADSLATDERTDATDTVQLSLYIRGVDPDLPVTEEFICMPSLHDTTKGSDLFSVFEAYMNRYAYICVCIYILYFIIFLLCSPVFLLISYAGVYVTLCNDM